jgi:flavin-dependent dehydrogenase
MDSPTFDIAVIGGGPAGMMAAGRAAELGARVILLEKNAGLGLQAAVGAIFLTQSMTCIGWWINMERKENHSSLLFRNLMQRRQKNFLNHGDYRSK